MAFLNNENRIVTDRFSSARSEKLFKDQWPDEPELREQASTGRGQCGSCSFFAPFNDDYGLCCHSASRHHLETVFEHFACPVHELEDWGPHSFTTIKEHHCRCNGESNEYYDRLMKFFDDLNNPGRQT